MGYKVIQRIRDTPRGPRCTLFVESDDTPLLTDMALKPAFIRTLVDNKCASEPSNKNPVPTRPAVLSCDLYTQMVELVCYFKNPQDEAREVVLTRSSRLAQLREPTNPFLVSVHGCKPMGNQDAAIAVLCKNLFAAVQTTALAR